MNKHLLLAVCCLIVATMGVHSETAVYQTVFNSTNNQTAVSNYTSTWTNTTNAFRTTIVNANNNNNGWEYIKFGRKAAASVGSITTAVPVREVLDHVTITLTAVTANKVNGITLLTSTDGTTFTERGSFTIAKGTQTATIPADARQANLYYQIRFDCADGSNGVVTVSKVEYYEYVYIPPTPTATLMASADTVNKGDTVRFTYTMANTETHELIDLSYKHSSATNYTQTAEPHLAFYGSTGTYNVFARIRVDNGTVINSDTISVYVKPQSNTIYTTATAWATAQELEVGDEPEPLTIYDVTLAFDVGTSSAVTYNGSAFSMKKGNTLSFSVKEGYAITSIQIYPVSYTQKTYLVSGNATWSSGTAASVSTNTTTPVEWTGIAQDVSVTVSGAVGIKQLIVYYADVNQNYFVTFLDEEGEVMKIEKVRLGSTATPPTPPTIAEKTFIGWRESSSSTVFSSEKVAAAPVRIDTRYTATYEFNADVLNETTTITMKGVLTANGYTTVGSFTVETLDYTKGSKSFYFNKGTAYSMYWGSDGQYTISSGNTIRIKSDNMMHKIVFTFNSITKLGAITGKGIWSVSGKLLTWEGSSADITFTCSSGNLTTIQVFSDQNNTSATVTFVGLDGKVMQQQELALNSKVTPPDLPAHSKTGMHYTWDKEISRVSEDVTYTAIEEPIINLNVASDYFSSNAVEYTSYSLLTKNNARVYLYTKWKSNTANGIEVDSVKVVSMVDEPIRRIILNGSISNWTASTGVQKGSLWYGVANEVVLNRPATYDTYYLSSIQVLSTPYTVAVKFLDADGRVITTQQVEVGSAASSPAVPEIEDMELTGWLIDDTFVSLAEFLAMPILDATTCIAQYAYHTYTVTFLDPDGKLIEKQKVKKGEYAVAPKLNLPEGTALEGWLIGDELVSPEELAEMPIVDFLTCTAQYTIAEGYHTVTFLDSKGNLIESKYIKDGAAATAPQAPTVSNYRFVGWRTEGSSEIITNEKLTTILVVADITYTAVYELDLENATPLTVGEAKAIGAQLDNNTLSEDMYLVKGMVNSSVSFGSDNIVSFTMSQYGSGNISVSNVTAPIVVRTDLQQGDTVIVYAYLYRGTGTNYSLRNGSVEAIISTRNLYPSSPAELMYDFTGDGLKEYIDEQTSSSNSSNTSYVLMKKAGDNKYVSEQFLFERSNYYDPKYLEDINGDGLPDISMEYWNSGNSSKPLTQSYISGEDGYTLHDSMAIITNFDINRDGRQDYLYLNRNQTLTGIGTVYYGEIAYGQTDGSFHSEAMRVMTWSEYRAQMTAEEIDQMNNPQNYSLGDVSRYTYTKGIHDLIGAALARAPKRAEARKAQGIGYTVSAPTKAIDLNGDGLVDLIDEKNGVIYTNMGDQKWVMTATNGIVIPADLNSDGITDYIFPGNTLYVSLYDKSTNAFATTTLYSNAAVDDVVYVYDFDRDGDIDLLATFSAANNATNTAYTCFFKNDGQGNFTRQVEQSYGSDNLLFRNLQDIDGDGYYDLLAYRADGIGKHKYSLGDWHYQLPDSVEVVWLQGQANLQFAQPTALFKPNYNITSTANLYLGISETSINAEDIDNDGKIDIWLTDVGYKVNNSAKVRTYTSPMTGVYTYPSAQANSAPTPPAAPVLQYDDSLLTITWGDGSDDHTMSCDLTYALRIGTSSGAMDILRPHANADGSRRNFLDGNMGRTHSYTIDLSSYAPGTIYVAVQAVDAQHQGSAWSAEATVRHEKLPVEFTVNSTYLRLNDKLTITYTELSDEYKQEWSFADGNTTTLSASQIEVLFPTGGFKTITHTITAPDGRTVKAEQVVRVLPVDKIRTETKVNPYLFSNPTADFNYDGRADVLGSTAMMVGTTTGDLTQQAEGLWNTNFLSSGGSRYSLWYDYNRDGQVDFLLNETFSSYQQFSYLPHAANQNTLSDRVDDDNVGYLFGFNVKNSQNAVTTSYTNLAQDLTHNGRYDVFKNSDAGYQLLVEQEDGSYVAQSASDIKDFVTAAETYGFMADFDHDGFVDLAQMTASALNIAFNRGEGRFEKKTIPFAKSNRWANVHMVDFNGDGYIDILFDPETTRTLSILWNNKNESFSAPEELPKEELIDRYMDNSIAGPKVIVSDIDGNGYPDIAYQPQNQKIENSKGYLYGLYVWFMGAEGVENYGFLLDNLGSMYDSPYMSASVKHLAGGEQYILIPDYTYQIITAPDAAPQTPTGLVAKTTDEGLLIQWNNAEDDHTPAQLMRYNLSVRLQGSNTYLISPLNGGKNGTMPLSDYTYINATQFLIPASVLSSGVYEIAVQALDMQQHFSDFTPAINAAYTRENPIEVAAKACANSEVLVTYRGALTENVPTWNFDGGEIVNGSGFGPYTISWQTGGEKNITLTINEVTYTQTITIDDPYDMEVTIPALIVMERAAAAIVPAEVTYYEWYAKIGDDEMRKVGGEGMVLSTGSRYIVDRRLTSNGLQITAHEVSSRTSLTNEEVILYLYIVNANGCSAWFSATINVVGDAAMPTILLVTVDENGHNVVNFDAPESVFPYVRILKETNVLNQFAELAIVPAEQWEYTDMQSDATQKSDRYKVQGIMADNSYSSESATHKTVHATISRGVQDGTFNLIWNAYEGADVVTYNILRGSSETDLTEIASVAASATSYTDLAPVDAEPYYVVEYMLSQEMNVQSQESNVENPKSKAPAHTAATLRGRSNVVNRGSIKSDIEDVVVSDKSGSYSVPQKILIDGHVYILLPDGRCYDSTGKLIGDN